MEKLLANSDDFHFEMKNKKASIYIDNEIIYENQIESSFEVDEPPIEYLAEDSKNLLSGIFKNKPLILKEHWESSITIQGMITKVTPSHVFVDCLLDKENKIFENRKFSKNLFEGLDQLKDNLQVLIATKTKPGSARVDIYKGAGIVDVELFNDNSKWDFLNNSGMDTKLNKW